LSGFQPITIKPSIEHPQTIKTVHLSPLVDFKVVFVYVATTSGWFSHKWCHVSQTDDSTHSLLLLHRHPCAEDLICPCCWPCRCPSARVGGQTDDPPPAPVSVRPGPHAGGQAGALLLVSAASSASRSRASVPPSIRLLERQEREREREAERRKR
jgi:hypothetical protein